MAEATLHARVFAVRDKLVIRRGNSTVCDGLHIDCIS